MTQQMILSAPLSGYGASELKQKLHKNVTMGLTLATIIYGMLLGSYWSSIYLTGADIGPIIWQGPTIPYDLIPQPRIGPLDDQQIAVSLATRQGKPKFGTPVAVPDITVDPQQVFVTQQQLSETGLPGLDVGKIKVEEPVLVIDQPPADTFFAVQKLPIPVKRINPRYPEMARQIGLEGRVWAKVWIDKKGKVRQVVILKSDSELFDEAVIAAVKQWSFAPALMNNGPVDVWMSLPFVFKLNK